MIAHDTTDFRKRLGFVLHHGLVEIRYLAHTADHLTRIHDLADLLEFLPKYLDDPSEDDRSFVCTVIREYEDRHPDSWRLLKYLHGESIPDVY